MKKRLLSLLMCLCMALILLPTGAFALETEPAHSHPACGETCGHEGEDAHAEAVTYTALTQAVVDGYETHYSQTGTGVDSTSFEYITIPAGNYYLAEDITTDKMVKLGGSVNLCFNGRTFTSTLAGTSGDRGALMPANNATLNTCDCQGGGGFTDDGEYVLVIKDANATVNLYGGKFTGKTPVRVYILSATLTVDGATLDAARTALEAILGKVTVKSGQITNQDNYFGAVDVRCDDFTVTGGTIKNTGKGYALQIWTAQPVKLSGSPVIQGGEKGDISLEYASCKLTVSEDLTGTYSLNGSYVKEDAPRTITTPADADQSGHFTSATPGVSVRDVVVPETSKHTVQLYKTPAPAAVLAWAEDGESKSTNLTSADLKWYTVPALSGGATDAQLTVLQDAIARLEVERGLTLTLTGDENGPHTLSRDMDTFGSNGLVLSVGEEDTVTVTNLTLDGATPDEPPNCSEAPQFVSVDGSLTLGDGATVQNCQPIGYYRNALPPAAVAVSPGGTLTLESGSKIIDNQVKVGGVVVQTYATVNLSGNVTIQGNYFETYSYSDDDELLVSQVPANLAVYASARKPVVTGSLQGSTIGLTLLCESESRYPVATSGKVVEGKDYTLTDTDLAAFFSDRPGFFPALRDNAIYLDAYAITTQPTALNPAVAVNYAPTGIQYQWYPAAVTPVTPDSGACSIIPDATDEHYNEADGTWTAVGSWFGYFAMEMNEGDALAVTLPTSDVPAGSTLALLNFDTDESLMYSFDEGKGDDGVTAAVDGGNTVVTFAVPKSGEYGLILQVDVDDGDDDAPDISVPAVSATVTAPAGGPAAGQNKAKLTAEDAGDYLCRVTWPDGTMSHSDVVAYEPAAGRTHTHTWAAGWTSDATGHWHACTATGCDITDYAACGETGAAYGTHVYTNDQDITCNTCGYEREVNYAISGMVTDHESNPLADVTVTLIQGSAVVATATTDSQGNYSFTGVRAGLYNVIAEKDGVTKTILVELTDASATEKNIQMPEGKTNSVVEVKGRDTPAVVAGGVDAVAEAETAAPGDTVTVKLTVEKQDSPTDKDKLEAIISGKKDDVLYLDLSLVKQVNDQASETIPDTGDKVLEIAVPYDFTGKKDVTVYRKHGENDAEKLTKLTARPAGDFQDGTFYADGVGKVYIYASKFSTYAIGYTEETTSPVTPPSRPSSRPSHRPTQAEEPTWPFADVTEQDWHYECVKYVYEKGLMEGTSDTTFAPGMDTSRAIIATILWRLSGSPEPEAGLTYPDCEAGSWYAKAVAWGTEAGILKGYDTGDFGPNDPITREQMALILWRYAGSPKTSANLDKFVDGKSVSDWVYPAMEWAVEQGILTGKGGGVLDPTGQATRAEVAAMLMRYLSK